MNWAGAARAPDPLAEAPSVPHGAVLRAGVQVLINNDDTAWELKIRGEEIENSHKTFTVK